MTLLWCSSKFAQLLASERSERDTLSRSSMKNAIRVSLLLHQNDGKGSPG